MERPNSKTAALLRRLVDELGEPVELHVVTNHMTGRRVIQVRHARGGLSRWTLKFFEAEVAKAW